MPLTEQQKADVRRHLGFDVTGMSDISAVGGAASGVQMGTRFFDVCGQLEYKMQRLSPTEEAILTGKAIAAVAFVGQIPDVGDTATITVSGGGLGSPVAIVITAAAGDTFLSLAAKLQQAVTQSTTMQAAGIKAIAPYGAGPYANTTVIQPECAFVANSALTVTLAMTGKMAVIKTADGGLPNPSYPVDDAGTVVHGYLPIINYLEGMVVNAGARFAIGKADVVTFRGNELELRKKLLRDLKSQLAQFLGIPRPNRGPQVVL